MNEMFEREFRYWSREWQLAIWYIKVAVHWKLLCDVYHFVCMMHARYKRRKKTGVWPAATLYAQSNRKHYDFERGRILKWRKW